MKQKHKIKSVSAIGNIPNISNGFCCVPNATLLDKRLLLSILFLFSFFAANAQVFVSDSALVTNKDLLVFSETNKNEVSAEKTKGFIFIGKNAAVFNKEKISNSKIIAIQKEENRKLNKKPLAITRLKGNVVKYASTKHKKDKPIIFGYKNSENKNRVSYYALYERFVVIPDSNYHFKPFTGKGFVLQLPHFDYSKIHTNHSFLVVDYHQYFLYDYHNRPPPFLG